MKLNETFYAKTHAEFLNETFGTNYKACRKCVYPLNDDYEVWMIRFDGKIRDGWKNHYQGDIIKDVNCENKPYWDGMPVSHYSRFMRKKLVFEIIEMRKNEKMYVFRGVYEYQIKESDPLRIRIYKRISNNY